MTESSPSLVYLADNFTGEFPNPSLAMTDPNGLLAVGANLSAETLLQAYSQGIFPWYSEDQPILWWSPNPRCVLFPKKFHVSRRFKSTLNQKPYVLKTNTAFRDVMLACAKPRPDQKGTWIHDDMIAAYCALNEQGKALSVECWSDKQLIGGIYGLMINDIFYGESMFSIMKDASKIAMHYVCNTIQPRLIDAQIESSHLISLGAELITRNQFLIQIKPVN